MFTFTEFILEKNKVYLQSLVMVSRSVRLISEATKASLADTTARLSTFSLKEVKKLFQLTSVSLKQITAISQEAAIS